MLNQRSINLVNESRSKFSPRFVQPRYEDYCFSNIPGLVEELLVGSPDQAVLPADVLPLGDNRIRQVALIFLDSFGWAFFERALASCESLSRLSERSTVSKLTAQFPSTTAAHATCIHTGLSVGQSGVYEWNCYEPSLDLLISPLSFSFAGEKQQGSLLKAGVKPEEVLPTETFYQRLVARGVRSVVIQSERYSFTPYSSIVTRGAEIVPYRLLSDGLEQLAALVVGDGQQCRMPSYYHLYFDKIDGLAHSFGPASWEVQSEVERTFRLIEERLILPLSQRASRGELLLMLVADHGQTDVNPSTTVYLNNEVKDFDKYLTNGADGRPLVPAGSARDLFLHVRPERLKECGQVLRAVLGDRAKVLPVAELIAAGYFGSTPVTERFTSRVGNLVVLPYAGESVWWFERKRFEQRYLGHHGGLTPEEMEIPFIALRI